MTPIERADRAEQLLADPVLKQALADIKAGIVTNLEQSGMDDVDTHHQAALSLQLLKQIETQLRRHLDDYAMEKHRKEQESFIARATERVRRSFA